MSEASRPARPRQRPSLSDVETVSSVFESVDSKVPLEDLVNRIFTKDLGFDVTNKGDDGNPAFEIINVNVSRGETILCLDISFEKDLSQLYIHRLNKCGEICTGSDLLRMVDQLVNLIPQCNAIELYDEAYTYKCGTGIELSKLEILKTGQSWYNKHGYKQDNYDDETDYNKGLIEIPVSQALRIVEQQTLDRYFPHFSQCKAELDAKIPQLRQVQEVQDINSLKLNQYIKILFDYIKSFPDNEVDCNSEQNDMARKVAHVIKSFIKARDLRYNPANRNLRKVLSSSADGGSKKRTMRKSHRRTKTRPRKTKTRPRKTKTRPRKTKTRPRKTKTRAKFRF
jgi:hypothetical protein